MNLLLAISQLILCVVITIFEYKKRSIGMFLWAILLVIFSIPHFIGICMAANIYDKSVLQEASLFFIAFQVEIIDILFILAISILMPILIAIIGLFTNLKYPKMNASSDTEVVKQSMSTTIAVFSGMILGLAFAVLMVAEAQTPNTNLFVLIELIVLAIVVLALWKKLKKYGNKRFKEINV